MSKFFAAATLATVIAVVATVVWWDHRMSNDEITALETRVSLDSSVRVAATTAYDRTLDSLRQVVAKPDTVWRKFRGTVPATVTTIVTDTVPDAKKITELVEVVQQVVAAGDSAVAAAQAIGKAALDSLARAHAAERASWMTERVSLRTEVVRLKELHVPRRWGLGMTCGGNPADPKTPACVIGGTVLIR